MLANISTLPSALPGLDSVLRCSIVAAAVGETVDERRRPQRKRDVHRGLQRDLGEIQHLAQRAPARHPDPEDVEVEVEVRVDHTSAGATVRASVGMTTFCRSRSTFREALVRTVRGSGPSPACCRATRRP